MTDHPLETESPSLLLVEDDAELAGLVGEYLLGNGFVVGTEVNGLTAVERIVAEQPDLVILDVMLPGIDGMEVCKRARQHYSGPILMLTALDEDIDQMLGLELGADDYVIKPVKPRLLLTRIRTLLRRTSTQPTQTESIVVPPADSALITVGQLQINHASRSVTLAGQAVDLTTAEYELLLLLAQAAGQPVDRDTIVQALRGFDYDGFDRSIDRRVSRLRKKLHDDPSQPQIIKTVRGKGYQLCSA